MLPLGVGALGVEHHLAYLFDRRIIFIIFFLIFNIAWGLGHRGRFEYGRLTLSRGRIDAREKRVVSALLDDLRVNEVIEEQFLKIAL